MSSIKSRAALAVRIIALLIFSIGLWQLIANILGSISEFDPAYLDYYISSQLLHPILGLIFACLLYTFSSPIAKLLARGLDDE